MSEYVTGLSSGEVTALQGGGLGYEAVGGPLGPEALAGGAGALLWNPDAGMVICPGEGGAVVYEDVDPLIVSLVGGDMPWTSALRTQPWASSPDSRHDCDADGLARIAGAVPFGWIVVGAPGRASDRAPGGLLLADLSAEEVADAWQRRGRAAALAAEECTITDGRLIVSASRLAGDEGDYDVSWASVTDGPGSPDLVPDEGLLVDWGDLPQRDRDAYEALSPDAYSAALHVLMGDLSFCDQRWARPADDPLPGVALLDCHAHDFSELCGAAEPGLAWLGELFAEAGEERRVTRETLSDFVALIRDPELRDAARGLPLLGDPDAARDGRASSEARVQASHRRR